MVYRSGRVNPIAKALLQTNRRRPQVVPDKNKYNRKKDKDASEHKQIPHQADKQTPDD